MTLSSYNFVLLFLPAVMIGFYLLLGKAKANINIIWGWLIAASLVFYACDIPGYLLLLGADVAVNYALARYLARKKNRIVLGAGIILHVLLLFLFKYLNFGIDISNMLLHTNFSIVHLAAPMGISFITFQQIAFLVDTYREQEEPICSPVEYLLFVTFFPRIISGPIITKKEFIPLLRRVEGIDWDRLASGIQMFLMGFGKKVLIADFLAKGVDYGYAHLDSVNSTTALCISVLYTLQIYFDFSGYSDMAMGVARMLQLDLPVNFNSPYKAVTIAEFWDRWHMTLTGFLTRYVYIPLGGSRRGKVRTYVNILIVFLISGLWHGASYTFILWGLFHGIFMVLTRRFDALVKKIPRWINHTVTLLFVNFTWVLFRANSLGTVRDYVLALLKNDWGGIDENVTGAMLPSFVERLVWDGLPYWVVPVILVMCIIWAVLFMENTFEQVEKGQFTWKRMLLLLAIGLLGIMSMSGTSTFIYAYF